MARYKVTVVSPGVGRPVLVVPFQPDALVTAFIDELFKRIARLDLQLRPDTHIATLHLDSETGAILDCEDLLSDVVGEDEKDKLFMVLKEKNTASLTTAEPVQTSARDDNSDQTSDGHVRVKVVTPDRTKQRSGTTGDQYLSIPRTASIRNVHEQIATHLGVQAALDEAEMNECNCKLAAKIADDPQTPNQVTVVHGKSEVQHVSATIPTEVGVKQALRAAYGVDLETKKKITLVGGQRDTTTPDLFSKMPTAALCSKQRHIPTHARRDVEEAAQRGGKILDLHCTECPLHPLCMDTTLVQSRLLDLAEEGVLTIFAVVRNKSTTNASALGKNAIFRAHMHWEPAVSQSDRGISMFLSALRVTVSFVQDMDDNEKAQDAVLHALDLLTGFKPAVRTLHILVKGKTPSAAECAALSQAVFEVLDTFMPTSLVGTNRSRLFEGSRLFFGFVLEMAKALRLSVDTPAAPYLTALETVDIRDSKTFEPILHGVNTDKGLMERDLLRALQENGPLATSNIQDFPQEVEDHADLLRIALLSGGASGEVMVFSSKRLLAQYTYRDGGNIESAVDMKELCELEHLAELCGLNKLAVHRPSQLSSSVKPCLTFDRNGLLGCYTGEEPCGVPGKSSIIFRPQHGESSVDTAVLEQLIAPILQRYEADGTAVFDALGGAVVRRLQQPDEILMFCVDRSASMRTGTDFHGVNDDDELLSPETRARTLVEGEHYSRLSFEDLKDGLSSHESFKEMVGIVADASPIAKRLSATKVIQILRIMLSATIIEKSKELETLASRTYMWHSSRAPATTASRELSDLKDFWAALKTHESATIDFLIYRALADSRDISERWYWSMNDAIPVVTPPQQLPSLPTEVTEIPHDLRCPISHTLMTDAVTSSDGFHYARSALMQWFTIRNSSPMTGLPLQDTAFQSNADICTAADAWIQGKDLTSAGDNARDDQEPHRKRLRSSDQMEVIFDTRVGSFSRTVSSSMNLLDLYKLVFRGLQGRHTVFQLSSEQQATLQPMASASIADSKIKDGDHITVRIAENEPRPADQRATGASTSRTSDTCLVKVYESADQMLFGFWTDRTHTVTLASILWKYWRWTLDSCSYWPISEKQVWMRMVSSGDGLLEGCPRVSTDRLAEFLTRDSCFGKLAPETVYERTNASSGPLVLKVKISEPWQAKIDSSRLTRLAVLKQMFEAVVNRMIAYNYRTHVGLITVSSQANISMGVSHVLENLRKATNDMHADGDTSLWDALALAKDIMVEYQKKYPEAKKRIICISDGEDTTSKNNTASDVCWNLREAEIAVDTVALGSEDNIDLRTISYLTGGYILQPKSLANALAMCEMEPFLSLTDRPDIAPPSTAPRARVPFMSHFWVAKRLAQNTRVDEDNVPPIKRHPNLEDEFMPLTTIASRPVNAGAVGTRGRLRTTRLMNEMRAIVAGATERTYDVYVSEADFTFWKIVLKGPEGSPYSAGNFLLYLHAEDSYPTSAPKARFITKIKHPNINSHGLICHSLFGRDWTSDISMTTLLDTVYGLLLQPEHSDPVNTTLTLGYHHDEVEFADQVRAHVWKHARKTKEQWKAEILGEVDPSEGEDENMDEDEMHESDESFGGSDLGDEDII